MTLRSFNQYVSRAFDRRKLTFQVLQRIIYYVILAPYDNEQSDLLHRVVRDTRNSQVPLEAQLLKLFTVHELMRWPEVSKLFGPHLCGTDVYAGRFFFRGPDEWVEAWRVKGPRKNYASLGRFYRQ